jgi:hypothetical protein
VRILRHGHFARTLAGCGGIKGLQLLGVFLGGVLLLLWEVGGGGGGSLILTFDDVPHYLGFKWRGLSKICGVLDVN